MADITEPKWRDTLKAAAAELLKPEKPPVWNLFRQRPGAAEIARLDNVIEVVFAARSCTDGRDIVTALQAFDGLPPCHAGSVIAPWTARLGQSRMAPFLLACHRNGYIREQAVKSAGNPPNPVCLSLLLLRLDDWVPEVRTAAEFVLTRHLPQIPDAIVADAARLVLDVSQWHRLTPQGVAIIDLLLARPVVRDRLTKDLAQDTSARGERIFQAMLMRPQFDDLIEPTFAASRNGNVAGLAFRLLLAIERGHMRLREADLSINRPTTLNHDRNQLLLRGMACRWPRVRALALRQFSPNATSTDTAHRRRLEAFLFDRSWSVVSPACFWLKASGGDPRRLLLDALGRERPLGIAQLQAFAAVGKPEDAEALRRFHERHGGVRSVAALAAACALEHDETEPLLLQVLWHGTTAEACAAARALARLDVLVPFDRLYAAAREVAFIDRGYWHVMRPHGPVRGLAVMMRIVGSANVKERADRVSRMIDSLPDYLPYQSVREVKLVDDMATTLGRHPQLDAKFARWFRS